MERTDQVWFDFAQLDALARQYGGRFYIFHPDRFKENINAFSTALSRYFSDPIMGYSFKTNYVPALCRIAAVQGCWAEVVSGMEYDLALALGYTPDRIIFNGPVKSQADVLRALDDGAVVNLDSLQEVAWVVSHGAANPNAQWRVGLRINIELRNEHGVSAIQDGLRNGRFGLTQADLQQCMPQLHKAGIAVVSIHGHTSSTDRAVDNYARIATRLLQVCRNHNLNQLRYFNVGGGFFGAPAQGLDVSGKPTYADYAARLAQVLRGDAWFQAVQPTLVVEPGVSVVANVFDFVTRVHTVKHIDGQSYVVVEGSVFDIKPSMHRLNLPFDLVRRESSQAPSPCERVNVVGSTCMEKDVILDGVDMALPTHGDYLAVRGVGAYTVVFTPVFINALAPILVRDGNTMTCVRRAQTVDDIMGLYD